MEKIAQAVVNAGFSLRYLNADLAVDNSVSSSGQCFTYKGDQYVFTQPPKRPARKGIVKLKFIGKKYLSKSEFKKMEPLMNASCNGVAGKVYHVAM